VGNIRVEFYANLVTLFRIRRGKCAKSLGKAIHKQGPEGRDLLPLPFGSATLGV